MDKKLTTTLGIALGASLLAGAGFGIYKYFSRKRGGADNERLAKGARQVGDVFSHFIGNGLVKSNSLYGGTNNNLIGGGLYKGNEGIAFI